jgi:thiamine biosynthesis protein ThiS
LKAGLRRRPVAKNERTVHVNEAETIRVQVNGKEREIAPGLTVHGLLEHLELQPGAVVVELNREILARDSYEGVDVSEGDTIELVHFVGGG